MDLSTQLGRLRLPNPVMVASGTFGYAREMVPFVDCSRLGAILPKSITRDPRPGNRPWRTVETSAGLLNAIGLDNDGIDYFVSHHLPFLRSLHSPLIVSIAGKSVADFVGLARQVELAGGAAGLELNISCPNVAGGIDFATDPDLCYRVVSEVRAAVELPVLAKLSPNVTRIVTIAEAAERGGADAVCLVNTLLGIAVDWRRRRPMLGNVLGGLSGPAIKPIALRCVYQVAREVGIPIVGIGGIASTDDAMEYLVTGASAIQIGTANYYDPSVSMRIVEELPRCLATLGAASVTEIVGTLAIDDPPDPQPNLNTAEP